MKTAVKRRGTLIPRALVISRSYAAVLMTAPHFVRYMNRYRQTPTAKPIPIRKKQYTGMELPRNDTTPEREAGRETVIGKGPQASLMRSVKVKMRANVRRSWRICSLL